jgi:hypothetical protein
MIRPLCCMIVLLAIGTAILANPRQDLSQDVSASALTPTPPIVKRTVTSKTGSMPMPLVAPLFVQDANTESEITMVNNSSKTLNVEIMLTSLAGAQIANTTVEMMPYSQKIQKLSDLLATVPPSLTANLGSVLLMPNRNASLAAQLSILSRGPYRSDDIEEEFAMMMDPQPTQYRGVVGNISGSPVVAIRSVSSTVQTLSVACMRDKGTSHVSDDLQIAPNQTLLIQACRASGVTELKALTDIFSAESEEQRGAAVSVSSSAASVDIAVFGIGIQGEGPKRTPIAMPFWDVNTLRSSTAVYPGVTAEYSAYKDRSFRLRIALANFGSSPQSATVWLTNGTGASSTQEAILTEWFFNSGSELNSIRSDEAVPLRIQGCSPPFST